jgi:hypothetical protein
MALFLSSCWIFYRMHGGSFTGSILLLSRTRELGRHRSCSEATWRSCCTITNGKCVRLWHWLQITEVQGIKNDYQTFFPNSRGIHRLKLLCSWLQASSFCFLQGHTAKFKGGFGCVEVSQTWPLNCPWGEDDPMLRDIYYKVSKLLLVYCSIYYGTKRGFLVLILFFY